ncbi:hypothetical protein ACHAWU_001945 [Discostella pseudostelligera]|uniref:Mitochondrial carrier protein n=1 Tax=Discostella pseudostelligera TaxID=259834 RepID=A0ABD3MME6_9STRA
MKAAALFVLYSFLVLTPHESVVLASPSVRSGGVANGIHLAKKPALDDIARGVGVGDHGGRTSIPSTSTKTATSSTATQSSSSSTALTEGLKSTLASGLAAACSKTILAPFDTIKTVQQHVPGDTSLGLLEACQQITSRTGGIRNLYAGLGVSALGSMPSVGLYFGVYSYCKRVIEPKLKSCLGSERSGCDAATTRKDGNGNKAEALVSDKVLHNLAIGLSAAIGNTVASFSRVPYEVIKQSLQTGQYATTTQAISHMWTTGGIRSFFPLGGISIQMLRDIPYAIFTLLSYEYIKEVWVLKKSEDDPKNRWIRDMIAGATAGGIGSYVTNPFDVIKTRLQTTSSDATSAYGGSITACALAVMKEGGPMAFLRGSVPRLIHKIPANGFFFVFYEFFKRVLRVEHHS